MNPGERMALGRSWGFGEVQISDVAESGLFLFARPRNTRRPVTLDRSRFRVFVLFGTGRVDKRIQGASDLLISFPRRMLVDHRGARA